MRSGWHEISDMMTIEQLTGQTQTHLREVFPGHFLHEQVIQPYRKLVALAAQAGLDLRLASGFRSFDRQLAIWNAKASGARPVLDDKGKTVAMEDLSDIDRVRSILRWSALPGASRHHWGTDMDVWDAGAVNADYQLQLVPEEYAPDGVFQHLNRWLEDVADSKGRSFFYRPYAVDCGGLAPEPWHLSYRPVAEGFERALDQLQLRKVLENTDILYKQTILDNFEEICYRYVRIGH